MSTFIDNLFFFIFSFLCAYSVFMYMVYVRDRDNSESDSNRLKRRINMLSKQQDALLEGANKNKISTFTKIEHQSFGSNIDSASNLTERILIIMKKAGISDMSLINFVAYCFIGGVIFTALILYFDFLNTLTGVPIGMTVGAYLVYTLLKSRAEQRKMQFLQQFPDAIDMMIRGVKAGLNIGRIMKLVSLESKDPVATEYRIISQKFDLGVEPEKVLLEAADRIDIEEFRFLVVALVLQMENGGVLGDILANLAGIVRKRLELGLKLKAMSAEARMSAIVLSVLPFIFAGIMALVNPDHLKEFVKPGCGQTLLKIGIVLFSMGTFFMIRATKIKV